MRIVGISGSARRDSHNTKLLRAAAEALPSGAELVEWEGLATLPIFDEDLEAERPAPVAELLETLSSADAIVIATPEYNHSIPGGLKNALDWASRPHASNPLRDKPALVVGAEDQGSEVLPRAAGIRPADHHELLPLHALAFLPIHAAG